MTDTPENAGKKQDGKFKPGHSGNPAGKLPGTRNKVTLAIEKLIGDQHAELTKAAIDKALEGDTTALRLCLDRLAPARKDNPVSIDLPPVKTVQDAIGASEAIMGAVSRGEITPDEAGRVMALLHTHKQLVETGDIEKRLEVLEQKQSAG